MSNPFPGETPSSEPTAQMPVTTAPVSAVPAPAPAPVSAIPAAVPVSAMPAPVSVVPAPFLAAPAPPKRRGGVAIWVLSAVLGIVVVGAAAAGAFVGIAWTQDKQTIVDQQAQIDKLQSDVEDQARVIRDRTTELESTKDQVGALKLAAQQPSECEKAVQRLFDAAKTGSVTDAQTASLSAFQACHVRL